MNFRHLTADAAISDCGLYTITFAEIRRGVWHNAWFCKNAPGEKHLGGDFDREAMKKLCAAHAAKLKRTAETTTQGETRT